jgi:hypothetical protein
MRFCSSAIVGDCGRNLVPHSLPPPSVGRYSLLHAIVQCEKELYAQDKHWVSIAYLKLQL